MAAFRFRLARLLRARDALERVAQADWGRVQRDADAAQLALEEATAEIHRARAELARLQTGGLDPATVLTYLAAIDDLGYRRAGLQERAGRFREQAEHLRRAFDERRRERRSLELLEERDRAAFRRQEFLEESAQMDEVASARSARPAPGIGAQSGAGRPGSARTDCHPS